MAGAHRAEVLECGWTGTYLGTRTTYSVTFWLLEPCKRAVVCKARRGRDNTSIPTSFILTRAAMAVAQAAPGRPDWMVFVVSLGPGKAPRLVVTLM